MREKVYVLFLIHIFWIGLFAQQNNNGISNTIIVSFKEDQPDLDSKFFDASDLDKIIISSKKIGASDKDHLYLLTYSKNRSTRADVISALEDIPEVNYAEPNYQAKGAGQQLITPNDEFFYNRQWGLFNDGTFSLSPATEDADIDIEAAWDISTGDPNLVVAVLDTGLRMQHPEFSGRIWINEDESNDGNDTDNNGYIDDSFGGWDFVNGDNDPTDDQGHGTNVTGIALATGNNTSGYAGINWQSKIMSLKVLDEDNSGFYSDMIEGIYYAVNNGASVINMSLGGSGFSTSMQNAVNYAYDNGVIIVACMMNENNDVTYYPAGFDKTIAVGSTNPNDERSEPFFWNPNSGSNYGDHIDLVAPGNYMWGLRYDSDTNYNSYWGGTSQATPLVAGVVSLILSHDNTKSYDEIYDLIRFGAEDQVGNALDVEGWDPYYGHGRLNAENTMGSLLLSTTSFENSVNDIIIFPNPSLSQNYLTVLNTDALANANIYDATGKLIKQIYHLNSNRIDISNISDGMYILHLTEVSGNTSTHKIIIN
ncbi:S8 family peptidase [Gangjinia marincola]|uniref:S8 family peptidase n=1 Tax=Gangjinia marincola TaxID=578463 RepID=A0ABP3XTA4_9FLAO